MPEPKIAGTSPIFVELTEGKEYCFCTCGLAIKQPFCDGEHKKAGEFKSLHFIAKKTEKAALCACKQSKKFPYCDGSHTKL